MRKTNEVCDECTDCDKEEIVHQFLEVQAQVTVTPLVNHGTPKAYCVDSDIKQDGNWDCVWRPGRRRDKCTFTLSKVICVEIPITFDVDVDVDQGITRCCEPDFGPCKLHYKNT